MNPSVPQNRWIQTVNKMKIEIVIAELRRLKMKTLNMTKIARAACLVALATWTFAQEANAQKHCYCRTKGTNNVWMSMAVPDCGTTNVNACVTRCVSVGHLYNSCH